MIMATFSSICKSLSLSPYPIPQFSQITLPNTAIFLRSPAMFPGESCRRRVRGLSVVTRAGPSTTQYIFAFVFPLSLLAITAFTAFRIGDKLDQKFLEELAMNEALREEEEEEDDISDTEITREEEPALPRTRNRPKREV